MKTASNLEQKFFQATADREAFAELENTGGLPSRRVGADRPVAWLPADSKRGPQGLTQEGWRWSHFVS